MEDSKRKVVFNFNHDDSDKEDESVVSDKKTCATKDEGNCSDGENSSSHITNMDLYDRLNFKRIEIKRNSRKGKTGVCQNHFTIEKFTDEITKITEDLKSDVGFIIGSPNFKKRTIRFANKRVTYQYPKENFTIIDILEDKGHSATDNLSVIRPIHKDSI